MHLKPGGTQTAGEGRLATPHASFALHIDLKQAACGATKIRQVRAPVMMKEFDLTCQVSPELAYETEHALGPEVHATPNAGQKGSDTSAREATRKLVAARKQLLKLHQVLLAFGSVPARELQLAADSAADGLKQAPRNMIVRNTLRTLR